MKHGEFSAEENGGAGGGTFGRGGVGTQQLGRALDLCKTGADENSVAGTIRTRGGSQGGTASQKVRRFNL